MRMFVICASLIAGVPLATAHGKTTFSDAEIRDAECLALFAHDLGSMPKGDMEKWPRSVSMVLYYIGKLRGSKSGFRSWRNIDARIDGKSCLRPRTDRSVAIRKVPLFRST